jgi:type IV secretory pathway TraG/TraD family ATPase VirD4
VSVTTRRRNPVDPNNLLFGVCFAAVVLAVGGVWAAVHLGYWWENNPTDLPGPIPLLAGVLRGDIRWTVGCTAAAAVLAVAGLLVTLLVTAVRKRRGGRDIDAAAAHLGRGRDLRPITASGSARKARRLGVENFIGLPVGDTVAGGDTVYQGVEDVRVTIAGMRAFKSSAFIIPDILAAPGFCLTTSNRRDTLDATRDLRAADGDVWVFDPQRVAHEPAGWWWDPLSFIPDPYSGRADEARADYLGLLLYGTSRPADARSEEYFGPEGAALVGGLLLAAAAAPAARAGRRTILDVYRWATAPGDTEPARILEAAGYVLPAQAVRAVIDSPAKERSGIYGGVRRTLAFLRPAAVQRWVTDPDGHRPCFDPAAFVRGPNTLYSLSREGVGTAGPLVLALTAAVCEAAEELATGSGGRLPVPGSVILDEIANVCRWADLPARCSHYGGRGILVHAILQSYAQGVELWGETGMAKLATAANLFVYGGGSREVDFLAKLAQLTGHWSRTDRSLTVGRGGNSTGHSTHSELLLDVSDLASMRLDRALVFPSGAPATLLRKRPWMGGKQDKEIRASIAAHDPRAAETLAAADAEAAAWRAGTDPPDVPSPSQLRERTPWSGR